MRKVYNLCALGSGRGLADPRWLTLAIAPASGWTALLFHERHGSLWREVRAYLTLRLRPRRAEAPRALRREIRREIEALAQEQGAVAHEDPRHR